MPWQGEELVGPGVWQAAAEINQANYARTTHISFIHANQVHLYHTLRPLRAPWPSAFQDGDHGYPAICVRSLSHKVLLMFILSLVYERNDLL